MQHVFIYSSLFISFICTILPYRCASKQKCNNLNELLNKNLELENLNIRHLKSTTAMLCGIILYWVSNITLSSEPDFVFDPLFLAAILSGLLVAIVSPYTVNEIGHTGTRMYGAFTRYLLLRIPFIVIYEIYFRGVLLMICIHFFGVTAGVIINVTMYAAAHIYSSKKELIGTVPFGLALCFATIATQSVWPAILMHLLLAVPYEMFLLFKKQLTTKTV